MVMRCEIFQGVLKCGEEGLIIARKGECGEKR